MAGSSLSAHIVVLVLALGALLAACTDDQPDQESAPVLEWSEMVPPLETHQPLDLKSAGDGRIVVMWLDLEPLRHGNSVSSDGNEWIDVPPPVGADELGFSAWQVDVSGDRWLAVVNYVEGWVDLTGGTDIYFSDDRGATWTELALDTPVDSKPESPWLTRVEPSFFVWPAASGTNIVAHASEVEWAFDALLESRDLLPEGNTVLDWRFDTQGTVVFGLQGPSSANEVEERIAALQEQAAAAETPEDKAVIAADIATLMAEQQRNPSTEPLELSHEDLGLTVDELAAFGSDSSAAILWSDGAVAEVVAHFEQCCPVIIGTDEGFLLADAEGDVRVSTDGRSWVERPWNLPLEGFGTFPLHAVSGGTAWSAVAEPEGFSLKSYSTSRAPVTAASFAGLTARRISAGPAGLAVSAVASQVDSTDDEGDSRPAWQVGFSPDGASWQWEPAADAFGLEEGAAAVLVQMAVGQDFVLALVAVEGEPITETVPGTATRWFIAPVR